MEGLRYSASDKEQSSLRGRIVLLVVLPVAFLGAADILFVEYVLQSAGPEAAGLRFTLRVGGAALLGLALVLAAACGWLLADRVSRPLRLLLRLASGDELAAGRARLLERRGREVYQLYRLVNVLITQNRAGARAMEELDSLRRALHEFREGIMRTGHHGIPPAVRTAPSGPIAEIESNLEAKRLQLLGFFSELRERLRSLREEMTTLGVLAGLDRPATGAPVAMGADGEMEGPSELAEETPTRGPGAAETEEAVRSARSSVERLRRLGTVLVLEAGRIGEPGGHRVASLLSRFESGIVELEGVVSHLADLSPVGRNGSSAAGRRSDGIPATTLPALVGGPDPQVVRQWQRLLEGLDALERRLGEVETR